MNHLRRLQKLLFANQTWFDIVSASEAIKPPVKQKEKQMNCPIGKESVRQIRTIAMFDGAMVALKYIRTYHVETLSVAKQALNDILTNQPWTYPTIKADIDGMRIKMKLNRLF